MTPEERSKQIDAVAQQVNDVLRGQPLRVTIGVLVYLLADALENPTYNRVPVVPEPPPPTWDHHKAQPYLVWLLDDLLSQLLTEPA